MTLTDAMRTPAFAGLLADSCITEAHGAVARALGEQVEPITDEPPGLRWVREMVRERADAEVAKRINARKGVVAMEQRRSSGGSQRRAWLCWRQQPPNRARRLSSSGREFLAGRDAQIAEARAAVPERPSSMERWNALMPSADGGRVPDPQRPGSGVVEASVAAVPLGQRGWREMLRARGVRQEAIDALEKPQTPVRAL